MSRHKEKSAVEDYRALDIRSLHRAWALAVGWRGNSTWTRNGKKVAAISVRVESLTRLRLNYQVTSQGRIEVKDYAVPVSWTACHLGGNRPWFGCPSCGRRVAILYGGEVFVCRHCRQLNYASQQTSKRDRALERSWLLRHKLGTEFGMYDIPAAFIPKPKGMHWKTFNRNIALLHKVEARAFADSVAVLAGIELKLYSLDQKRRLA